MNPIPCSELIINDDGTVFHLHLLPEQLADTVILVGDPGRVRTVASFFDSVECDTANREFVGAVGTYKKTRFTVLSTGIGTDNIDIVMNELDALANIDFNTRTVNARKRSLRIVRLGTSGAIRPDIPLGSPMMSAVTAGIDGLLNFYRGAEDVCDTEMRDAFIEHTRWPQPWADPYFVHNDPGLIELFKGYALEGLTFSTPGFYAPQGRVLRLGLAMPDYLESIAGFSYNGIRAANFEMESSAIAGLAQLLGHKALTICTIIAQRSAREMRIDYHGAIHSLIEETLDRLSAGGQTDES